MAHIPQRMCIACRVRSDKSELIRLVNTDEGIIIDKKQNIPARGVYICKNQKCISLARKKKALSRQFKDNINDSVYEKLCAEVCDG